MNKIESQNKSINYFHALNYIRFKYYIYIYHLSLYSNYEFQTYLNLILKKIKKNHLLSFEVIEKQMNSLFEKYHSL
jgi:hypothetical protein